MSKKLTAKQEMFCKEYIKDLNASRAARAAGYSPKTADRIGHENLKKLEIAEYIQKLMNKRSERVQIDADDVLRSILDIRATCTSKIPLTSKQGEVIGEGMVDINGALKANELLGKHLKLFTEKQEVVATNLNADIDLTDEEVDKILKDAGIKL